MDKLDKIYIVHYKNLINRRNYLEKELLKYNITNYEFITDFDRNNITKDIINKYYIPSVNIAIGHICTSISQVEIYNDIIKNNYNLCLVLEDDAILLDNFYNNLNSYLTALPDDIDMAFLHDGCGFHAKNIKDNQIWYREKYSRTCCSYLITKDACEKISKTIIPMSTGIDHELNKQIDIHNLNVYWCEPVIIREGSQIRFYNSSV